MSLCESTLLQIVGNHSTSKPAGHRGDSLAVGQRRATGVEVAEPNPAVHRVIAHQRDLLPRRPVIMPFYKSRTAASPSLTPKGATSYRALCPGPTPVRQQ